MPNLTNPVSSLRPQPRLDTKWLKTDIQVSEKSNASSRFDPVIIINGVQCRIFQLLSRYLSISFNFQRKWSSALGLSSLHCTCIIFQTLYNFLYVASSSEYRYKRSLRDCNVHLMDIEQVRLLISAESRSILGVLKKLVSRKIGVY